ncbi:MAG: AraC family transcriptional regulator [Devosia sp.]
MATGAGYEQRENETYSWEGRRRGAFSVIQHTIAGRGELDFDGVRHALLPGDTMVLNFPHDNRYWLAPGGSWEYFWIGIQGVEALRITRAVIDEAGPVLHLGAAQIDRLAAACLALAGGELPVGMASSLAYSAVMAVHDGVFQNSVPGGSETPLAIRRVLNHIDRGVTGNLSVDRLAAIAKLSRAHFVRVFTGAVGQSPSAHVQARRLQLAERLLVATDASIAEIASSCGFADANYFAKSFRRAFRLSPSEFRASRFTNAAVARG